MTVTTVAKMTVTGTPGFTRPLTLGAAVGDWPTFAQAGVLDGQQMLCSIADDAGAFISALCTFTSPDQLAIDGIYLSSASDHMADVSLGAGTTVSLMPTASPPATEFVPTGTVWLTLATTAPSGWVLFNDGTIGSATSGATLASATTQALYTLLWNNVSSPTANAYCAVTGGLGANAAADWAANKKLALPKTLGRALAVAGAGSGLTSRALGSSLGEETHAIATGELPAHTHTTAANGSVSVTNTTTDVAVLSSGGTDVTGSTGSGTPMNVVQPTSFLNAMAKL